MMRYATRLLATLTATMLGTTAGPALAESVPVRIDRDVCANVVAHVPDADVTYKPGVDVSGKPVAPADLPGSAQIEVPDNFVITLELNLARSGFRVPGPRGLEPKVQLGVITVEGDRVFYNGQPLDASEQTRLAAACRDFLKRRR
jgi:hypothetical protein